VIEWEIMKGMLPGQSITLHRMGNTLPGHLPGNVVICLCVAPHPTFKMISPDSRDLLLPVTITLSESLLGMDRVLFRHLNGREIRVYMPGPHQEGHAVIKHGDLKAIRGMGLPAQTSTQSQGDLWIKFDIEWPSTEWLRLQDLNLLQSVLPSSRRDVPETDTPQEYANLESAVINKV
jgi:DnaJ family protein A protein 2